MSVELAFPGWGTLIVDEEHAESVSASLRSIEEENRTFHERLISMGVKAYRCNDGWVDREKRIITFTSSDNIKGGYWGNKDLKVGDKIFLKSISGSGQFAIVERIVEKNESGPWYFYKYHYNLIEEYLDRNGNFSTISEAEKERRRRIRVWVKTAVCSALFLFVFLYAIYYITTK